MNWSLRNRVPTGRQGPEPNRFRFLTRIGVTSTKRVPSVSASDEIYSKVARVLVESLNVRNSTVPSPFKDSSRTRE